MVLFIHCQLGAMTIIRPCIYNLIQCDLLENFIT
jgi:hypothetical protein